MQIHDLGSLWVESEGLPLPLNGKRMATALSVLVVNLNQKVRTEVLIDAVWGADPSPRTPAALDTLMWRLRRVLDPGRSARAASTVLRTEDHGYRLTVGAESVDSWQFAGAADRLIAGGPTLDPAMILELTSSALGLWRGRPYDDLDDADWLQIAREKLVEQLLGLRQSRIEALLAFGKPEQAVAELVPMLAEHPFAENLWASRILALYRTGRAAAALAAYSDVQQLLDRELGLAPGPQLQRLQGQILRHDPDLAGPAPARPPRSVVRIPRHRTTLVGRGEDMTAVDELLMRHRLVSVIGPVGCGKTRLASAVAAQVQGRFGDGVYFVDLSDVLDDELVAERVQQTLRVEGGESASATQTVVGFCASREVLIVLDNCEQVASATAALVAAVTGDDGPTRILVTSRRVLDDPNEVVYSLRPLPVPTSLSQDDLENSSAVTLFLDRAATHGTVISLDGPQGEQVARICQALDGLPLGIELAAGRTQVLELHEVAAGVVEHPLSLAPVLRPRQRPTQFTLNESIGWSHGVLTEQQRIAHRRLSVLPPPFTLDAVVAACAGPALPADEVANALIGLTGQSMLEATKPERMGGPSLFRQLVPIRAHADVQLSEAQETASVQARVLDWISTTMRDGPRLGQPDGGITDQWLDDNRRTITAMLERAIDAAPSDDHLITLCRLVPYWWLDGKLSAETVRLVAAAVDAAGPANSKFAKAAAVAAHRSFVSIENRSASAPEVLLAAIGDLREAPPGLEIFAAELLLAIAAACWVGQNLVAAGSAAEAVAAYGELLDDNHLRVLARSVRCAMGLVVDPAAAAESARVALVDSQEVGNFSAQIMCLHTLYMAAFAAQDGLEGLRWNEQAIRVQLQIGQRNTATTLEARGGLHLLAGNPVDAVRCYGAADLQYSRLGRTWPQIPGTEQLLDAARKQVSEAEFDEAWSSGERLAANDLADAWV